MSALCSKCHAAVADPWKFCPHCGTVIPLEPTPEAPPEALPAATQKAPAKGAFTGLLFGMLVVPILAIVGAMLCLTGLGAILGVPMIIAAIFAPLLGPMIGIGALHGDCPWCGTRIHSLIRVPQFYCHACSKRILIKDRKFIPIE
jgi:DNA-directed RNA polymerase subunit RPC12/RpoP